MTREKAIALAKETYDIAVSRSTLAREDAITSAERAYRESVEPALKLRNAAIEYAVKVDVETVLRARLAYQDAMESIRHDRYWAQCWRALVRLVRGEKQ